MTAAADAPVPSAAPVLVPSCAWCHRPARAVGGRLAECDACGAATTWPVPDASELEAAYRGWYRPDSGRFGAGGDALLRRSRATLARRLDRVVPPGPVLDVGSGDGTLLDALRARGREAVGLERTTTRPDVRTCELAEFDERPGEWAAIVFWHSLEHLRDPGRAIDRAVELLSTGGLLAIAIPNRASWQARTFGERWFALDIPRHLVHLGSQTLIAGLRGRELQIERISYWRGGQVTFGWLHGLVGLLPGTPDLYDAIRRPDARSAQLASHTRVEALAAGAMMSPVALALALAEVVGRAGGTMYLEARRR